MKTDQKLNMTMLCDFYELTMGNGYLKAGFQDRMTYFDVYSRSVPDGGGYAIAAGLDQLIDYIEDLHFDEQDIAYLRSRGIFCEEFLDYLANFHFSGDIYAVPISHGEGRFLASEELVKKLAENGQIATQYVDLDGYATMDAAFNPNGSICAIGGITSPDGRVFGKMGHTERIGKELYRNVPGQYEMELFTSAVRYFK